MFIRDFPYGSARDRPGLTFIQSGPCFRGSQQRYCLRTRSVKKLNLSPNAFEEISLYTRPDLPVYLLHRLAAKSAKLSGLRLWFSSFRLNFDDRIGNSGSELRRKISCATSVFAPRLDRRVLKGVQHGKTKRDSKTHSAAPRSKRRWRRTLESSTPAYAGMQTRNVRGADIPCLRRVSVGR